MKIRYRVEIFKNCQWFNVALFARASPAEWLQKKYSAIGIESRIMVVIEKLRTGRIE